MRGPLDVIVIGGGIIGLATAYRLLQRFPDRRLSLLEKESRLGRHQTGHNSGVLHSGIYYRPGSLKAITCREGKAAMEAFCARRGVDYDVCGKVIVAVDDLEAAQLVSIYERGRANGIDCELIDVDRLRDLEPHAAGLSAIHVPGTAIVDFQEVSEQLGQEVVELGGVILTRAMVTAIKENNSHVVVESTSGAFEARYVVNCGGLYSDRIATLAGNDPRVKIVPFRGDYYRLNGGAEHYCRNLLYPVPDPRFPFLGVHATRRIRGGVECGPTAVLAFAREGYTRDKLQPRDLVESLTYPGFARLAMRHWRTGAVELWRSFSKRSFARALQRIIPEIEAEDLEEAPAGVRGQAVDRNGSLIDDFLVVDSHRIINVCNAPSPAATAALSIGQLIVNQLAGRL